jgi:Spinocerebellar ataxia type 10 protein domain
VTYGDVPHCQIDDANPLVKEWALWGVRNLSGNAAVKQTIEQLQAQGVAATAVLEESGFGSDFDPVTKRPRLVRVDPKS